MVRMYRRRSMSAAENRRYPERDLAGSISPSASRKRILDVLMSGNSGCSWASTSPMPNWPRADASLTACLPLASRTLSARSPVILAAPAAAVRRGCRADVLAGQEQHPELADLHFVPADQFCLLDPLPVHVGAVEAAHVADREPRTVPVELGVPPGDRHVVEEDVAVRMTARGGQVAVEPEPAARVGTAHDQEQRASGRQRAERRGVGEQVIAEIVVGPAQRDRRGGLPGAFPGPGRGVARRTRSRREPGPGRHRSGQLGSAVRAEPGPVGIRPAAPGAVDTWHGSARPPLVVLVVFERSSTRYARGGGAVHAPREQPAPSAPAIFVATLPPHRCLTSARNARDSLTFANSASLAPFTSSREGHSLPGHGATIRGPNRSIRDSWPLPPAPRSPARQEELSPVARPVPPPTPSRRAEAERCRRRCPRP